MTKNNFLICFLILVFATVFVNISGSIFCSSKIKSVVALEKGINSVDGSILMEKAKQAEQSSLNQLVSQADTYGFKETTLVVYASTNKKVATK
ncbi:hypothetical protein A2188_02455 [Candidatus Woesebacteria bacterium RIFOXYA1_FULL_43_9]|uniref:Uncharacterized protein n=1 Tax=Candidatus Woesebacteria bacterium RIFOXYA1_FULL_43_9 TaxID=1802534 RepID=A0A1F8CNF5_9BACT|nr:MAG: hypothetical protein A2188_02455 [Candidatus Woesebacteria bacterium RIFOXYA1_FULL_43_9]